MLEPNAGSGIWITFAQDNPKTIEAPRAKIAKTIPKIMVTTFLGVGFFVQQQEVFTIHSNTELRQFVRHIKTSFNLAIKIFKKS